ncbi:hypothetical protein EG834_10580 [bacterium]|nr:hypothetical protein [bacterium]
MTIDEEWMTTNDGQMRYTVTGDSSLQLTQDGETLDVRYEIDGDTLTMSGSKADGILDRVGSSAYEDAKAEWDKQQAEQKAKQDAAAAEEKKQEDATDCKNAQSSLSTSFNYYLNGLMDGSFGGGEFAANTLGMSNAQREAKYQAAVDEIHAQFSVGMKVEDVVAKMLVVGKNADGQYGSNSPILPENTGQYECPSGGIITITDWGYAGTQELPKTACSIHGTFE